MGKNQSASNLPNIIQYSNGSINFVSGSTLLMQISSSGAITTTGVISGSNALSSSYAVNADQLDGFDSTAFVFTSSYNSDSSSVSTRVTKIEGNYATTGSNVFMGAQTVCANITSTGTIIAQTLNVQQVTSSIVYSSGSNIFGCSTSDVQQMTGSVRITGSLNTVGTICSTGNTCFGGMSIVNSCLGIGTASPVTTLQINATSPAIRLQETTSGGDKRLEFCVNSSGVAVIAANQSAQVLTIQTVGTERLRMDANGISCFACQICTTSAALSSNIVLNRASTSAGNSIEWRTASTLNWYIGTRGLVNNSFYFVNEGLGANNLILDATTGVATFACQVCAPQGIFINGAASLQAQFGQNSDATGTQTSAIDIISRNAANTAGFTFRIQNCATTCTTHLIYSGNTVIAFRCDGNVGIGTASPNAQLHVSTASANTQVRIGNNSTYDQFIYFNGNNDWSIGMDYSNSNAFVISNQSSLGTNDRVVITTGGNVGIGTTSPGTILTVEGANRAFPLLYNTGYGNVHIQTNETTVTQNFGGSLTFGGLGRTSGPTEKFIWAAIAGRKESTTSGDPKGYLQFGTLSDDTNEIKERMRITSAGVTCFACQVCAPTLIAGSGGIRSSNNIIFPANLTTYTIWNEGYGGAVQLRRSDATTDRYARIGIVDNSGNWVAGMTINGSNSNAEFGAGICGASYVCATGGAVFASTNMRVSTGTAAGNSSDPAITTGGCTKTGIYFAGSCVGFGSGGNGVLLNAGGTLFPAANGTQDLGTSSLRWCTVYTSDLSLNNGIGDYTIVEGENDLFLYNNKQCKVYKFVVQEVCPEIAPAKRSI